MSIDHVVDSKHSAEAHIKNVWENLEKHGYTKYSYSHGRTSAQNNAMHRWFEMCADTLNAHGLGQKAVISASRRGDLPNTKESVKEIYKLILKSLKGKDSTAKQTTVEPSEVFDVMTQFFAENLNVVLPEFPRRR